MEIKTKLYKPKEVAVLLEVHIDTVFRWLNSGTLKGFKLGGSWRITEQALSEFMGGNNADTK